MITGREKIEPIRIAGIISQDTYDWAIETVQNPENIASLLEHARWIINGVHDGTLAIAHD